MAKALRTIQGTPVQSKFNQKWACTFKTFSTHEGKEYMMGDLETAALWFDAAAAVQAGERALQALEETGRYPNLCEIW